ncbi:hypothetical protein HD600_001591 [Microbacterium ginsengiterrae]|uniref:Uncharacterized protein n=1 Tax=Microbacterium ginsengiterrae TaxID=546115 RepID=A0A7W9CCJ4_9MICO|nr:hypothetical protein [Microbacterium ginsengiterrae]MBB5743094.1 hypothetical protein [Microbacterium ginsengiterrae]
MSLPELPADPPPPSRWARRVSRDAPHGLDVLEAHVLAWAGQADALSKTPWWRIAWGVSPLLALLASIGGFAAVFGNPRDIAIGRVDAPDAGSIPWAMVSYGVAALGVVLIFLYWFTTGRRRNGSLQVMLVLTFAFGVLGLLFAYQLAAEDGGVSLVAMLPAFVMMPLAVVVFVIIQLSPKPEPEPAAPPVAVADLDEKAMRYLMRERNEAIKTLAERRMLPNVDVEVLKARPLGRLHIEEDA